MIPFRFHPEALEEYMEAARYYENRRTGLGARFTVEVESTLSRIRELPERWPIVEEDVRRCLTHTFPFALLYVIESDHLLVLAVMHCAREPRYWKSRAT